MSRILFILLVSLALSACRDGGSSDKPKAAQTQQTAAQVTAVAMAPSRGSPVVQRWLRTDPWDGAEHEFGVLGATGWAEFTVA